jgi:hypothetical protein
MTVLWLTLNLTKATIAPALSPALSSRLSCSPSESGLRAI